MESSQRAVGNDVLDLSGFTPTYESVREKSQINLKNSYDSFPLSYDHQSIESWYGQNVSDIIYFSIKPSAEGNLDLSGIKERDLSRLNNMHHSYGINLYVAVSGSSELFNPVTENEEIRRIFIDNLLDFCRENNFSGVDFDWEFPNSENEIDNYSLLIGETVALFQDAGKTVSAAVSRYRPLKQEIYDNLHFINLMAYDFLGRHSTYESAVEAAEFLQIKYSIAPEKINLGIPFYGRIYSGLDPQYWTNAMYYSKIRESYSPEPGQDEAGGYYFNGIDTVKKKTGYAIENKLRGVMIWELGQDTLDEYSLLKAINEEIQ
jgi:GH18 family chitinase